MLSVKPHYRPDIDGLRAIAILWVMAFHAFPTDFPSGFIGVDLFFVISGYLITQIMLRELQGEQFSILGFWQRRVHRIFPALGAVLLVCALVGWLTLLPTEWTQFLEHGRGAATFISNHLFWREAGYFDTESDQKVLLHTWSLALEEQFYVFWPLLICFVWRFFRRHLWWVLLAVTVASFALQMAIVEQKPEAAFFALPARLWELALGACLASVERFRFSPLPRCASHALALLGCVLFALALSLIDATPPFAGLVALLPTIGAVCLIAAGPQHLLAKTLLNQPLLVGLGRLSYSLYLWHWPLLVFCRAYSYGETPLFLRLAALILSVLLAWLSYRFIEQPLRYRASTSAWQTAGLVAAMFCGVMIASVLLIPPIRTAVMAQLPQVNKHALVQARYQALQADLAWRAAHPSQSCGDWLALPNHLQSFCQSYNHLDQPNQPVIVVWGDSHALAWAPPFIKLAQEQQARLLVVAHTGCPPLVGVRRTDRRGDSHHCQDIKQGELIAAAIRAITPQQVWLVARWSMYEQGLSLEGVPQSAAHFITADAHGVANLDTARAALTTQLPRTRQALGTLPIVFLRDIPNLKTEPLKAAARGFEDAMLSTAYVAERAWQSTWLKTALSDNVISLFDINPLLCDLANAAPCATVLGDVQAYTDDNHINALAALSLRAKIAQFYSLR